MKLFGSDGSHWYQRDGSPLHSVVGANGNERPTTLRDARKLGLLPSVTNVLGMIAKPQLTEWLQEQAVLAALTLPRLPGECEEDFARRVVVDAQSPRDNAASFGTAMHAGCERVALTGDVDDSGPQAEWLRLYRDWFRSNVTELLWCERVLVSAPLGYAGTADLMIDHREYGLTLVDIKTQGIKRLADGRPGKASPWASWCYQLAAYRKVIGLPVQCMNVVINSKEVAAPVEVLWSQDDLVKGWQAFDAARTLWCIEKGYDPRNGLGEVVIDQAA